MTIFPLKTPLNSDSLIKTTCHLYRLSFFKVLPWSILLVCIYNFMIHGSYLYPARYVHLHSQIAIFCLIIFFPLIGTAFSVIDAVGKNQVASLSYLFFYTCERFLSLTGCFFSMLLVPTLIFGLCVGIYFVLGYAHVPDIFLFIWQKVSILIIFASLISRLFAPILVFTDKLSANDAIDASARIVKKNYLKTFIFALLGGLILVFFSQLSAILIVIFPSLKQLSRLWVEGFAQSLLCLIGPWSFALLLTLKYDLQSRILS